MMVDPNAPAYPSLPGGSYVNLGLPIRLAIAAQIMANANGRGKLPAADEALIALEWADALIAAHNRGQA